MSCYLPMITQRGESWLHLCWIALRGSSVLCTTFPFIVIICDLFHCRIISPTRRRWLSDRDVIPNLSLDRTKRLFELCIATNQYQQLLETWIARSRRRCFYWLIYNFWLINYFEVFSFKFLLLHASPLPYLPSFSPTLHLLRQSVACR